MELVEMNKNKKSLVRKFKIGDYVNWTNEFGVNLGKRKIIGFGSRLGRYCYFIDPIDTPWFPIYERDLKLYNPSTRKKKATHN